MAQRVKIDQLGRAMEDVLKDYSTGTAAKMKRAVERTAEETAKEIEVRAIATNRKWRKYIKAFRMKTAYEDTMNIRKRWYVQSPHYRLTHLLEYGHQVIDRNGKAHGKTRAFPHIKYGAELAERRLPEIIQEEMEK